LKDAKIDTPSEEFSASGFETRPWILTGEAATALASMPPLRQSAIEALRVFVEAMARCIL
jgi:hypothetical protein